MDREWLTFKLDVPIANHRLAVRLSDEISKLDGVTWCNCSREVVNLACMKNATYPTASTLQAIVDQMDEQGLFPAGTQKPTVTYVPSEYSRW